MKGSFSQNSGVLGARRERVIDWTNKYLQKEQKRRHHCTTRPPLSSSSSSSESGKFATGTKPVPGRNPIGSLRPLQVSEFDTS